MTSPNKSKPMPPVCHVPAKNTKASFTTFKGEFRLPTSGERGTQGERGFLKKILGTNKFSSLRSENFL